MEHELERVTIEMEEVVRRVKITFERIGPKPTRRTMVEWGLSVLEQRSVKKLAG